MATEKMEKSNKTKITVRVDLKNKKIIIKDKDGFLTIEKEVKEKDISNEEIQKELKKYLEEYIKIKNIKDDLFLKVEYIYVV